MPAPSLSTNDEIAAELYARPADWDYQVARLAVPGGRIVPTRLVLPPGRSPFPAYPGLPERLTRPVFDGGVYDARGEIVKLGTHISEPTRNVPLPVPEGEDDDIELPGNWLYGGRLQRHFGHFLTESLGRLWPYDALADRIAGIVFVSAGQSRTPVGEPRAREPDVRQDMPLVNTFLELLGIHCPVRLLTGPARAGRLEVSSQLMALCSTQQVAGHPRFRLFARRLAQGPHLDQVAPARRLYVSRARLTDEFGQLLMESWLDEMFAAAGYRVIHPELLPVAEQIALYHHAEELVFAEGSALHLFALVARPRQRVGIILRRYPAMQRFTNQLRFGNVRTVTDIEAVEAMILPLTADGTVSPEWNSKFSDSVIDYDELVRQLVAAGFLAGPSLPPPGPEAMQQAIAARIAERVEQFSSGQFQVVPRAEIVQRQRSRGAPAAKRVVPVRRKPAAGVGAVAAKPIGSGA